MIVNANRIIIFLAAFAALLFIPGLGNVHLFDWDEINFAESAREMILTGDYFRVQINFDPFWEKPPLFLWLQALSMKIFGINEFAARFPNALVGIATIILVYSIGKKYFSPSFGLLWAFGFIGSFLPHFYFKSGIIDPLFNIFIFSSIYFLYKSYNEDNLLKNSVLSGFFAGLAMMTKGPVGILIPSLAFFIILVLKFDFKIKRIIQFTLFGLFATITSALWFGVETWKNGTWFIQTFIEYNIRLFSTEDSGHGQPFFYHPLVLLIGCFPTSIFCLHFLFSKKQNAKPQSLLLWMQIMFWVVLILFSIVKTKIIHYSSLCYFPITFISAYYLQYLINEKKSVHISKTILISILGIIIAILFVCLPFFVIYKTQFLPFIKDVFAQENINANVYWSGFEASVGAILVLGIFTFVINRNKIFFASITLFTTVAITFQIALYWIAPKVEAHVQGTMINFLKEKSNEDCYIKAVGFKSYAQYFYSNRKPSYNKQYDSETAIIDSIIDKPAYLITKCTKEHYKQMPTLELIKEEAGWAFYKRK